MPAPVTTSSRPAARVVTVLCAAIVLAACQPVDSPPPAIRDPVATGSPVERLGRPVLGLADDLATLRAQTDPLAAQWQHGARLAELAVELDGPSWQAATVTYVAPDADRILVLRATADGIVQQRVTLDTLELQPVPAAGVTAIPTLPPGTLEPAALVEAAGPALGDCGVAGRPDRVLYATGAPVAWDGARWSERPRWRATVMAGDGGAVVDPTTGGPADGDPVCF
jgi:hypothetical protein